MQIIGWVLSLAANFYLLFFWSATKGIAAIVKRAIAAVVLGIVMTLAIALTWAAVGAAPSQAFDNAVFQCLFTVVVLAMTNVAHAAFRGMVETIASFHETHNAANIDRFPSRIVRQRTGLQRFSAVVWWLGSGLMLYGVWFDMRI